MKRILSVAVVAFTVASCSLAKSERLDENRYRISADMYPFDATGDLTVTSNEVCPNGWKKTEEGWAKGKVQYWNIQCK